MSIERKAFSTKLLEWWGRNQRKFPWRNSRDPYRVLISEILLHRTRADQVVPVYIEFVKTFPTIRELANAQLDQVRKVVYSLGLHWRTELLHKMAKEILETYAGQIPAEKEKLESLPGVSRYIASALRCFAFGYSEVLLDTNTVRILGRVFGIKTTDSSRRSKRFWELHKALMNGESCREFNYAMIDHGALVCRPKKPQCNLCPVNILCSYYYNIYCYEQERKQDRECSG